MGFLNAAGGMLAGLGLFFTGIGTLTRGLRQMTNRRFRMLLMRWTNYPLLSLLGGALLGATIQTGSAITFILVGMVSAGVISVQRSLPVRLGAAIGTSTMVLVATMDIQTIVLFAIGIGGVLMTQCRSPKPLCRVLFGAGLMFYGIRMVGTSAFELTNLEWFGAAITSVNGAPLVAFLLGTVLSIVVQSPQSVAILSIAMTSSGVLSTWTTIAIIYGSNFGGGVSTYLLSSAFRGTSRQIMLFQVLFNVLTGLVLLGLFFFERWTGTPIIHAAVTHLSDDVARQMAFVYLIFNVFGACMMYLLRHPILGFIERRWPPFPVEDQGKLAFLKDHALDTPDLALALADKEQKRFVNLLCGHCHALRLPAGKDKTQGETIAQSLDRLSEAMGEALTELGKNHLEMAESERLIVLINRNSLLDTLHRSLTDFAVAARRAKSNPQLVELADIVNEALDALLLTVSDAYKNDQAEDLTAVWEATQDRSEQMRMIRRRFMVSDVPLQDQERTNLMGLTNGLERTVWVLNQFIEGCL
jgi:phosphate:Na+ symporter